MARRQSTAVVASRVGATWHRPMATPPPDSWCSAATHAGKCSHRGGWSPPTGAATAGDLGGSGAESTRKRIASTAARAMPLSVWVRKMVSRSGIWKMGQNLVRIWKMGQNLEE
eukprot:374805-Pyramimonas_sp.AAC.2